MRAARSLVVLLAAAAPAQDRPGPRPDGSILLPNGWAILPPMSQFDAAARPMFACFTSTPDFTPYAARPAVWPLEERNDKNAGGAELVDRMNLATEDAADDILLNEMIWKSVKGEDSPMPAPRRAAFVRPFGQHLAR